MNAKELFAQKAYKEFDKKVRETFKFREDDIQIISTNILALQVCSPFGIDETTQRLNVQYPSGTSNGWVFDPKQSGEKEVICEDHNDRIHRVYIC